MTRLIHYNPKIYPYLIYDNRLLRHISFHKTLKSATSKEKKLNKGYAKFNMRYSVMNNIGSMYEYYNVF